MNVMEFIKGKRSKEDIIPGTGEKSDELCPSCGRLLNKMKPCCSSPYASMKCPSTSCGYVKYLTEK
jgi:hypothetical protein